MLRTSGIRAARGLVLLLPLLSAGCIYSFQAGAGFPGYVETVAIVPFDNETNRPELTNEVFQALLRDFPRSQGLQPAGEDVADAVVRGTITRYDLSTPSYRPGAAGETPEVLQRQVTLVVEVQVVNLVDNEILWESRSISVQGQYLEESETEEVGKALAIELLVQRIIDGAQSNW
ncbi:MAG: LPS assembly lipoprotein LptE [Gemmatimonadota bacterium]